jgi:hypothetical protein
MDGLLSFPRTGCAPCASKAYRERKHTRKCADYADLLLEAPEEQNQRPGSLQGIRDLAANLPVVPERIDHTPQSPAVGFPDRVNFRRAGR